jgi:hypothetical protein
MRIDVYHHVDTTNGNEQLVLGLHEVQQAVIALAQQFSATLEGIHKMASEFEQTLADIKADVVNTKGMTRSLIERDTRYGQLLAKIEERLKSQGISSEQLADLRMIHQDLVSNAAEAAQQITANPMPQDPPTGGVDNPPVPPIPSEPPPPPTPEPVPPTPVPTPGTEPLPPVPDQPTPDPIPDSGPGGGIPQPDHPPPLDPNGGQNGQPVPGDGNPPPQVDPNDPANGGQQPAPTPVVTEPTVPVNDPTNMPGGQMTASPGETDPTLGGAQPSSAQSGGVGNAQPSSGMTPAGGGAVVAPNQGGAVPNSNPAMGSNEQNPAPAEKAAQSGVVPPSPPILGAG